MSDPILRGREESTPFRLLSRVSVAVFAVVVVVGAIAYGLWSALN